MTAEQPYTVKVGFAMQDPEGTAPIRVVAGHADRVGRAWIELGAAMSEMADKFDALVEGGAQPDPVDESAAAGGVEQP